MSRGFASACLAWWGFCRCNPSKSGRRVVGGIWEYVLIRVVDGLEKMEALRLQDRGRFRTDRRRAEDLCCPHHSAGCWESAAGLDQYGWDKYVIGCRDEAVDPVARGPWIGREAGRLARCFWASMLARYTRVNEALRFIAPVGGRISPRTRRHLCYIASLWREAGFVTFVADLK